jgi:hypothetical protein
MLMPLSGKQPYDQNHMTKSSNGTLTEAPAISHRADCFNRADCFKWRSSRLNGDRAGCRPPDGEQDDDEIHYQNGYQVKRQDREKQYIFPAPRMDGSRSCPLTLPAAFCRLLAFHDPPGLPRQPSSGMPESPFTSRHIPLNITDGSEMKGLQKCRRVHSGSDDGAQ